MASSDRPRRKCVSVTFMGDDDVIQHIVDAHQKNTGKKKKSTKRISQSKELKYCEDVEIDSDSNSESDDGENRPPSTLDSGEGHVHGSEVFQFKTPKKSGSMAQKGFEPICFHCGNSETHIVSDDTYPMCHACKEAASEARTPKSILKNVTDRQKSEGCTPTEGGTTPKRKVSVKPIKEQRRPETTTPYKLRKRMENICDDIESDSSVSSDESAESESEAVPQQTQGTPRQRRRVQEVQEMPNMVEEYFDLHSQGGLAHTSDRTLSKLGSGKMDQEALNALLKNIPANHSTECRQMYEEYRSHFHKWMFQMCNGYNILLHGLGSKRALMEDFRKTLLKDLDHVVVNGYFPSLTIKHILNTITDEILEVDDSHKNPLDQVEFIKLQFEQKEYRDFFLVIHNIDGVMLRPEKIQNVLSLLSQIRGFHIIASIDHINAPLIWDQSKCSRFSWLWYDVTTYMPYTDETSYENSLLVQQTGALALSSMTHVMKSLTPNAKQIFLLLAKHQLENKDNGTYIGLSFQDLYQRCREGFLVNSDLTLRAQLIEFKDHKLLKSKKSYDGVEHLFIPVDMATLNEFVEQHVDS